MKTTRTQLIPSFLRLGMVLFILAGLLSIQPVSPAQAAEYYLVGYWKLDETSGTTAEDSSYYSYYDGTLTGGSWSTSHAPTGFTNTGSLSLTGAASQGITSLAVTSQNNNISMSAWVNWAGPTSHEQFIVYNGDPNSDGYGIVIDQASRTLEIMCGGLTPSYATSFYVLPTGSWHYVVAIRSSGTWRLYVDGTQIGTDGNPTPNLPGGSTTIGRSSFTNVETFNGLIDDVRIYNRVLTASEIALDPTAPTVTFGSSSVPPYSGATLTVSPTQLVVQFSEDVRSGGVDGSAEYGGNYLLLQPGTNGTFDTGINSSAICDPDHVLGNDDEWIRFNDISYDSSGYTATFTIESSYSPLANGDYRLYVCGLASVGDLHGNPLNGGASNTEIDFTVGAPSATAASAVPDTGFAPGRMTVLPEQTVSYTRSDLWLEIPRLGVNMDIVGVPLVDGNWDVSWLGQQAGWLQGSAFPTWNGNSVLTGHVWNADNTAGPFRYINTLWYGDQVIVHAWGADYVYAVRSVQQVGPGSTASMLKHEELPWVTLVTCRGYDEATGTYKYRVLVRAVLVEVK